MTTADTDTTDAAPVPSPVEPDASRRRRSSRLRVVVALALVLGAIGFLVTKGLGDATVYFKTADEAVRDRGELGDRRFRIEGLVEEGVTQDGDVVRFSIISAGVRVPVSHRGDPPELFRPGIPVVLEGRWEDEVYASDRIMVKHTSEYREKNPDRVDDYVGDDQSGSEAGGAGAGTSAGGSGGDGGGGSGR